MSTRKTMSANNVNAGKLIEQIKSKTASVGTSGYTIARGLPLDAKLSELPFADFFENNSKTEKKGKPHKKHYLNHNVDGSFTTKEDYTKYEFTSLTPFYKGVILTQQLVVSTGFFMYSVGVIRTHVRLAAASMTLNKEFGVVVDANAPEILEAAKAIAKSQTDKAKQNVAKRIIKEIKDLQSAVQVSARIIYEGDGLGGYQPEKWSFYGKLNGIGCPTSDEILTQTEAENAQKQFNDADEQTKEELFSKWFLEIHPEYTNNAGLVRTLYSLYRYVKIYQQLETTRGQYIFEDAMLDEENTWVDRDRYIMAALAGFFRRSAKGLAEGRGYESDEATRFVDILNLIIDEVPHDATRVIELDVFRRIQNFFMTPNGISLYGKQILRSIECHTRRNDIIDAINERDDENDAVKQEMRKNGMLTKVQKKVV